MKLTTWTCLALTAGTAACATLPSQAPPKAASQSIIPGKHGFSQLATWPSRPAFTVQAQNENPGVLPPSAKAYGKTYGDWGASWWAWAFSLPQPLATTPFGSGDCNTNQSGPVFFLPGTFGGAPVTRTCRIPAGKAIFLPLVNVENSTLENPAGTTEAQLRQFSKEGMDLVDSLHATYDGRTLTNLFSYRAASSFFPFSIQGNSILTGTDPQLAGPLLPPPVAQSGFMVSDGYWLMLTPPSVGEHELTFGGGISAFGFSTSVTYHLIVE